MIGDFVGCTCPALIVGLPVSVSVESNEGKNVVEGMPETVGIALSVGMWERDGAVDNEGAVDGLIDMVGGVEGCVDTLGSIVG